MALLQSDPASDQRRAVWLAQLRSCYPGQKMSSVEWQATSTSYLRALAAYSDDVVRCSLARCPKKYPQWFPALGQIVEVAEAEKRREDAHKQHTGRKLLVGEVSTCDPKSPFGMLAAKWESENKIHDGDRRTPHEVGMRRLREFWETWDIACKWQAKKKAERRGN